MSNSKLVYSTDKGRIKESEVQQSVPAKGDGIVRIHRETKGRKGKGVSLVEGIAKTEKEVKAIAKKLKQTCGTGGTVKNGIIEIQTDQREKLKQELEKMGFTVKVAGG